MKTASYYARVSNNLEPIINVPVVCIIKAHPPLR